MPLTRDTKVALVEKLTDVFKTASTVTFVHFNGLSVAQANEMRRGMREQGVSYLVAKKSLIHRALDAAGIDGDKPALDGEVAIAWSEDFIAPAREVKQFGKSFDDAVTIIGGIYDGRFMNQVEMTDVANIPPLEVLYGQFANVINSPIQGLVVALDQIASQREAAA